MDSGGGAWAWHYLRPAIPAPFESGATGCLGRAGTVRTQDGGPTLAQRATVKRREGSGTVGRRRGAERRGGGGGGLSLSPLSTDLVDIAPFGQRCFGSALPPLSCLCPGCDPCALRFRSFCHEVPLPLSLLVLPIWLLQQGVGSSWKLRSMRGHFQGFLL
jgi:hypothetical protein